MVQIGINGFGRIGRLAFRAAIKKEGVEVVAINDLESLEYLAYALKYDSVHGRFDGSVTIDNGNLIVNGRTIRVSAKKHPENISWDHVNVDVVIEATGLFTKLKQASRHMKGGAKKVVISAPSEDAPMFIMGLNHQKIKEDDLVFSNASCTANCLAPIVKILDDNFEIEEGLVSTIHAATRSQNTVDGFEAKRRRGRAAINNIIPTSTLATDALTVIMPNLKGKLKAMAFRVPTVDVSLIDLSVRLKKSTSYEQIKAKMKNASEAEFKGLLGYTEDLVVSQDFVSDTRISVFDASAGIELNPNFFKIVAWYDNEFGYANKIVDLLHYASSVR